MTTHKEEVNAAQSPAITRAPPTVRPVTKVVQTFDFHQTASMVIDRDWNEKDFSVDLDIENHTYGKAAAFRLAKFFQVCAEAILADDKERI